MNPPTIPTRGRGREDLRPAAPAISTGARLVQADAVATRALGLVHGGVGRGDEGLRLAPAVIDGRAHADRHGDLLAAELERLLRDGADEPLGQGLRAAELDLAADDGELLAAVARE